MKTTIVLGLSLVYFMVSEVDRYHYRQDEKWYEQTIMDLTVKLAKSEVAVEDLKMSLTDAQVTKIKQGYKPSKKLDPARL